MCGGDGSEGSVCGEYVFMARKRTCHKPKNVDLPPLLLLLRCLRMVMHSAHTDANANTHSIHTVVLLRIHALPDPLSL